MKTYQIIHKPVHSTDTIYALCFPFILSKDKENMSVIILLELSAALYIFGYQILFLCHPQS